jgi:large subunit ribosomal protein L22
MILPRYLKRMRPHGKGKAGKLEHARVRLTVIVKEMSAEQETDLARLRLFRSRGTRMTLSEARLVPHRVLATQWSRQRPAAASESGQQVTQV